MLTLEKLKVYTRFGGDIDGWARSRRDDGSGMTDADWFLIEELRQALRILNCLQLAPDGAA
jgi:hypothetical protein